ncbi:MAG: DUF6596 domain-containing protein [Myxococcota bacterium]
MTEVDRAVERAARDSYGRLVAQLAVRFGDVGGAEDALADAFLAALRTWPLRGVPDAPVAWLLTTARNRLRDQRRRQKRWNEIQEAIVALADDHNEVRDHRLQLLFACAHPAIAAADRTPLMLQTVLGVPTDVIAHAFLVSPSAMSKRLVRVKRKIKRARVPFELPDVSEWSARLDAVLAGVYATYGQAWDAGVALQDKRADLVRLRGEALHLAEVLVHALPHEPEANALLALFLYCEARANAQAPGTYIPFDEQDVARWDAERLAAADAHLRAAATNRSFGRYQLEAAIQSCHVTRRTRGIDTWREVALLYEALYRRFPTLGAWLGFVAATAETRGVDAAFALLESRAVPQRTQSYWALRANLHRCRVETEAANAAYRRAAVLTADPAVRAWLLARRG